ncbi:MAG: hypothetical protein ABW318_27395 [Vicinamibacterales bacterium]
MNHKEQFRNRARATIEYTPYVHESYATKPHDIGKDNGVSRCGRLGVPSHPVQHSNPKHGTAEDSEEGDQRGGGIRWDGINPKLPGGEHHPDANDSLVNRRNCQHGLELPIVPDVALVSLTS